MPHKACSQHECWLRSFAQIDEVALPQFQLLQAVEFPWFDEVTMTWCCDRGEVVGFFLNNPVFSEPGWSYFIRFNEMQPGEKLLPGHLDPFHESELREASKI